jgi:choline dehydrogenase-like flavoprotein
MTISDLQETSENEPIEADLCIIGSGPAGATIAAEMAGTQLKIVLLESGGLERQSDADALNEAESVGWPRVEDQWYVRNRMLGGSSATWGGRCATLDEIDYEARDWVPFSGWPVCHEDMKPYLKRSAPHLGLTIGTGFTDDAFWTIAKRRRQMPKLDERLLVSFFWQFSKDANNPFDYMRFAKTLRGLARESVRVFVNATVTHINTNETGSAVKSVEVRSRDGRVREISTPCVVLCGGGIENPRLLLASNRRVPSGIGNQNDLVGRFLMDHPRGKVGIFDPVKAGAVQKWLGVYSGRGEHGVNMFRHGLRLSPSYQGENRLLNCAVFLEDVLSQDDPWDALKEILRGRPSLRNATLIASNLGLFTRGLHQYFVERNGLPRKLDQLYLTCIVEQRPDPDSRITLSDRTDRFGMPLSRIDWHVSDQEGQTVKAAGRLVAAEFKRLGLTQPTLEDWVLNDEPLPSYFHDHAHPSATTRMSADPKHGVVDPDCEVHGVRGLFVAGTSVFPTVGHANPTQMIVALAIRLADRLKQRFATGPTS